MLVMLGSFFCGINDECSYRGYSCWMVTFVEQESYFRRVYRFKEESDEPQTLPENDCKDTGHQNEMPKKLSQYVSKTIQDFFSAKTVYHKLVMQGHDKNGRLPPKIQNCQAEKWPEYSW
jgi:hypothetical protein